MPRSEPALVAICTPASGLHSSSRTTSSYWYFALASALRSRTARSEELRPPRPIAELPPVSGPTKAIRTVSLAAAEKERVAISAAAARLMCTSSGRIAREGSRNRRMPRCGGVLLLRARDGIATGGDRQTCNNRREHGASLPQNGGFDAELPPSPLGSGGFHVRWCCVRATSAPGAGGPGAGAGRDFRASDWRAA